MCIGTTEQIAANDGNAAPPIARCYEAARAAGILLSTTPSGRLVIDAPMAAPQRVLEALWSYAVPMGLALLGRTTKHRVGTCDRCGAWSMIAAGSKPRCRMTMEHVALDSTDWRAWRGVLADRGQPIPFPPVGYVQCSGFLRGWTVPRR